MQSERTTSQHPRTATSLSGHSVSANECRELARIVRSADIYLEMWADTGKVHGPEHLPRTEDEWLAGVGPWEATIDTTC